MATSPVVPSSSSPAPSAPPPSAPPTSAPAPSPAPAAAPSTPAPAPAAPAISRGGDYDAFSVSSINQGLERALNPPAEPAPVEPAAPTMEAVPDNAAPPVEAGAEPPAVALPADGEVTDAPPAQIQEFQALKTQIAEKETAIEAVNAQFREAQAQLEQYAGLAPHLQLLESPGTIQILERIKPIVDAGFVSADDPRSGQIGAQIIKDIWAYNPGMGAALVNGVLSAYGAQSEFAKAVLREQGIPDEATLRDFHTWRQGGPASVFTPKEFPALTQAEMDAGDTDITVPMPDGTVETLDLSNKKDLRSYNLAKLAFEQTMAQEKAAHDAQLQEQEQQRTLQSEQAKEDDRVKQEAATNYLNSFNAAAAEAATGLLTDGGKVPSIFPKDYLQVNGKTIDLDDVASGLAHLLTSKDKELGTMLRTGRDLAVAGGQQSADYLTRANARQAEHIATAISAISLLVKKATDNETKAALGAPVLPDAPKVTPNTQVLAPPTMTATPGQPAAVPGAPQPGYLPSGMRRPVGDDYESAGADYFSRALADARRQQGI